MEDNLPNCFMGYLLEGHYSQGFNINYFQGF
jgi:hypothetical protein